MKPPEEIAEEILAPFCGLLNNVQIEHIESQIAAALTAERQEAEKWKSLVLDYCEDDGRIKALVRPILTPLEVDGDSYGVPGSLDIVETLLKRLKDAEKLVAQCLETLTDGEQSEPHGYIPTINACRKFLDDFRKERER